MLSPLLTFCLLLIYNCVYTYIYIYMWLSEWRDAWKTDHLRQMDNTKDQKPADKRLKLFGFEFDACQKSSMSPVSRRKCKLIGHKKYSSPEETHCFFNWRGELCVSSNRDQEVPLQVLLEGVLEFPGIGWPPKCSQERETKEENNANSNQKG